MDDDLRAPDCKIFINAEVSNTELIGLTAPALFAPQDDLSLQVEVVKNEDYDFEPLPPIPGRLRLLSLFARRVRR